MLRARTEIHRFPKIYLTYIHVFIRNLGIFVYFIEDTKTRRQWIQKNNFSEIELPWNTDSVHRNDLCRRRETVKDIV